MNFNSRFERGIKFEQADHFSAAGAVVSFTLILEVLFYEIKLIVFQNVWWLEMEVHFRKSWFTTACVNCVCARLPQTPEV